MDGYAWAATAVGGGARPEAMVLCGRFWMEPTLRLQGRKRGSRVEAGWRRRENLVWAEGSARRVLDDGGALGLWFWSVLARFGSAVVASIEKTCLEGVWL
jgi:hypothetical protein